MDSFGHSDVGEIEAGSYIALNDQPAPDAPCLNYGWSLPPVFAPGAIDSLYLNGQRLQAEAVAGRNRPMIGNLLLLAYGMDVVSDAEIQQAAQMDGLALVAFFNEAMGRIGAKLEAIQLAICANDSLVSLDLSVIEAEPGVCALVVGGEIGLFTVPLLKMPVEDAQLIYGCLYAIVTELGFGILADDLISQDYYANAMQECLDGYRASDDNDLGEWASLVLEMGEMEVCEFFDCEAALVQELASIMAEGSQEIPAWTQQPLSINQVRARFRNRKKNDPAWGETPWAKFIEQTLGLAIPAQKRRKQVFGADSLSNEDFFLDMDNGYPLDFANIVGIGLALEYGTANSLYEQTMSNGEYPALYMRLGPVAIPRICLILEQMAQAQGLLNLALSLAEKPFVER